MRLIMKYISNIAEYRKLIQRKTVAKIGFDFKDGFQRKFHPGHDYCLTKFKDLNTDLHIAAVNQTELFSEFYYGPRKNYPRVKPSKYMIDYLDNWGIDFILSFLPQEIIGDLNINEVKDHIDKVVKDRGYVKDKYLHSWLTTLRIQHLNGLEYNYMLLSDKDGKLIHDIQHYINNYTDIKLTVLRRIKHNNGQIYSSSRGVI